MVLATTILGFLLTNGHLDAHFASVVIRSQNPLLEHSLLAKEWQWIPGTVTAGRIEPWLREIVQDKLDAAERGGDAGASKKIRALCPDLASTSQSEGGVDLWISLTKQMQELQPQLMQLVEAAVRHKRKAAQQEERAVEVGESISQLRMRLALRENRRPRSWEVAGLFGRGYERRRIKTLFKWSVLRPSGYQKLRK